jgi:L-threonylcarbamoyladenylate synthase
MRRNPPPQLAGNRTLQEQAPPTNLQQEITAAVRHLREHGVVVLPTDTLYGLAADVFDEEALERVFAIKGRPANLALPVLVADWDQVARVTQNLSKLARRLAEQFWPGPLTLVVPKAAWVPDLITGGGPTVALRMPDHPVPLGVAAELGRPITGTSANRSGQADLLTLDAVVAELGSQVDYIVRCGPAPCGVPSTVVDVTTGEPRLLRPGGVPLQQILRAAHGR